jgi:ankyrin repeat protein
MMAHLVDSTPSEFLCYKKEKLTLLHVAAVNNIECVEKLVKLPYFQNIINDDSNEDGWSPLMWSVC